MSDRTRFSVFETRFFPPRRDISMAGTGLVLLKGDFIVQEKNGTRISADVTKF